MRDIRLLRRTILTETFPKLESKAPVAAPLHLSIIIIIVSFAVYFNALFNAFVFDDIFQILENQWIRDIRNIPAIFSQSVWGFNSKASVLHYYRPMMHLVYTFNYYLFGLKPWGFHLVNIVMHAGVSVLVFVTASRLLRGSHFSSVNPYLSPPFIAALLFATHPVHTEVVTWAAAVPELSFTFFSLLSLYLYIRSDKGSINSYVLSLVSYAFALFSKETALTLPIILAAYDFGLQEGPGRSFKEYLRRYIPYLTVTALYLIMRSYGLRDVAPVTKVVELSVYGYVINSLSFFAHYLVKLIFPVHLNAYHMFHPITSVLEPEGLLALSIAVIFMILVTMALKMNRPVFFSLVLVAVPLIPTFYIIGNSEVGISERYLYFPSFGFVLLLVIAADKIRINKPEMTVGLGMVLASVIGLYSVGTVSRNTIWKDEYTFFADTVKKSPDSAILHEALSGVLFNRGETDESIRESLQALTLNPSYAPAYIDLGAAYNKKGRLDKSAECFLIALQLKPLSWEAYHGLGVTYLNSGRVDEAIEQFEISLRLNPGFFDARKNICIAYMQRGLADKAIEHCRNAVEMDPTDADAHSLLGTAYKTKGLIDDAIEQYEAVVMLMPTWVIHNNLGILYDSKNMPEKAIEHYQAALKLQPDNAKAYHNLGIAYAKMGLMDQALINLDNAVKLDPQEQGFRKNLQKVLEMKNSAHKETR